MSDQQPQNSGAPWFPFPNPEILMALLLFVLVYGMSRQAAVLVTASHPASSAHASGQTSGPSSWSLSGTSSRTTGKQPVIVLDSGHGGSDPGKIGVDGTLEKDLNLAVTKRVKDYLEASDVTVILTRDSDTDLSSPSDKSKKSSDMRARCQLINDTAPDLVVSIHQNSYHEPSIKGGQVFYYKNSAQGKRLAELLQKRFDYVLGEKNTRQAKANDSYYLLLHVKSPIVIVECGFLSNPEETAKLNDATYQDRLAWTIHMGIMKYLNGQD